MSTFIQFIQKESPSKKKYQQITEYVLKTPTFFNNSAITLQPGTCTAIGVDDNTSKCPPRAWKQAHSSRCAPQTLGAWAREQDTGAPAFCSSWKVSQTQRKMLFSSVCVWDKNSCNSLKFWLCRVNIYQTWLFTNLQLILSFFFLTIFTTFLLPFSSFLNSHGCHTWLCVGCQSAFPAIWAGIQEKTCAAGPVPGETEGPQWCFTT